MKINITKKQYKQLLDLAYLGEWQANSARLVQDRITELDDIVQYIYSFAKDFGFDDQIEYEKKYDTYFPTAEFEERLQPIIDHNDNDVFWNELVNRLAKRDIKESEETFESNDAYVRKLFELEGRYEEEFEEHALKKLRIQK